MRTRSVSARVCFVLSFAFVFTFQTVVHAGVYSFGGGCASMGSWTQAALAQTRNIYNAIEALKNDPNCSGIEAVAGKIQTIQSEIAGHQQTQRSDSMESIPNEIRALRSFAVSDSSLKNDVNKLLMSRTLEGAVLATEVGASHSLQDTLPIGAIKARAVRAANVGVEALRQVLTTLPMYDQCLIGRPDQGMALVSAAIKMAAAFIGSGEGVTSVLGTGISGLVSLLRKRKFSESLRKLSENEFWISLSCLLETTTQTYCAAEDGYYLFEFGQKIRRNGEAKTNTNNPLAGYKILVRHLPIVSEWIKNVLFGVEPKFSADAITKNTVIDNVSDFNKRVNYVRAIYSEQMLRFNGLLEKEAKKNLLVDLIGRFMEQVGDKTLPGHTKQNNFFTAAKIGELIPFYLIGLDRVPPEVNYMTNPWDVWMRKGGQFQPMFDVPESLAVTIEARLNELIRLAEALASRYQRDMVIVDVSNLLVEAATSQTFTPLESLALIYKYLHRLELRIRENPTATSLAIVPNIVDTKQRIRNVLDAFKQANELGYEQPKTPEEMTEFQQRAQKAAKIAIETAYTEFNVLYQKDTFLSTRLSSIIKHDYTMRIRSKESMTGFERKLLVETGRNLLDMMIQIHGGVNIKNDLAQAQVINKRNLEVLETTFSDSLVPIIEELGAIASAREKSPDDWILGKSAWQRLLKDSYNRVDPEVMLPRSILTQYWYHSDRYPFRLFHSRPIRGADDKFESFKQFKAKLCIHTLAFEKRRVFHELCKDAVLETGFGSPRDQERFSLNVAYIDYMSPEQAKLPVTSSSICAFRDYSRRNLVYWLMRELSF